MRSIRVSLLVYFLALVTASLGVASLLVYGVVQSTLQAKEQAESALVETQFRERCHDAKSQLDDRLLANAKSLAGRVRPHWRSHQEIYAEAWLVTAATLAAPNGPWNSLVWAAQVPVRDRDRERRRGPPSYTPLQVQLYRGNWFVLDFGRELEPPPEDPSEPRISSRIQTNRWSRPMPLRGDLPLPDEANFAPRDRFNWVHDDVTLPDGTAARRVRFRQLIRLEEGASPPSGGPRPGYQAPKPAIIIQCAASLRDLEKLLEPLRGQRDSDLARIRAETTEALTRQRATLLLISGLTFAATVLGCFGLVWLGLLPLQRLTQGVSEISPRNFTLSLGKQPLPAELHPIAERLGVMLDQLRRAFAREKQATADISHELRTPLSALLTTIELALRRNRSPEQYREMLQECHGSATHMHQIVERLLTLARLDAGVDRLRARSVDVSDLAEQCAVAVRPLAEARGLRLSVAPGEGESLLNTDPDKLREVLNNLLHNAIQYNRPEGRIDLVVGRDNGHVRVEVRDTGIGIAPEARERIFERFYRADPSRACDGMNAGLGLAIVKEYVELMGGHISVESLPGQGSTFRVELPVQAPASAA
jgi:heavy metal sensor kinase